jgi:uncharacterized membrane protein
VLWFSKEAVRKAVQRKAEVNDDSVADKQKSESIEQQSVTNVVLLSLPVTLLIGVLVFVGVLATDF